MLRLRKLATMAALSAAVSVLLFVRGRPLHAAGALCGILPFLGALVVRRVASRPSASAAAEPAPQSLAAAEFVRRHTDRDSAWSDLVMRAVVFGLVLAALVGVTVALDLQARWPILDWLVPLAFLVAAALALFTAILVGTIRQRAYDWRCPGCGILLLGGGELIYNRTLESKCCPHCGREVLHRTATPHDPPPARTGVRFGT